MGLKNRLSSWLNKPKTSNSAGLKNLLSGWINKIETIAQPPKEIIALNFGLFESDKGFIIYLTGSEQYDPSNDDWATEIDYEPAPNLKYLLLTGEDIKNRKWDELLQLIIENLKEVIKENSDCRLFVNKIVTTGFDDGDLTVIKE